MGAAAPHVSQQRVPTQKVYPKGREEARAVGRHLAGDLTQTELCRQAGA